MGIQEQGAVSVGGGLIFRRTDARLTRLYEEQVPGAGGEQSVVDPPDFEQRDVLLAELGRLPLRQRAAVVLRYFEDLSEHQTGDVMGCSDAAVRSLVARAMETLRQRLETGSQR